jgi:hypothetical protein
MHSISNRNFEIHIFANITFREKSGMLQWGIDLIGQINPSSSKGHKFVLLATDYFTKWVEAIPLKKVTSENMVEFVKEYIIYIFGIP